jgi:prepilin-type N-terminal cleavage/methylation domain-containing protein
MKQRSHGFTLIEVLVAVALSAMLLSVLGFAFRISTLAARNANLRATILERLRLINVRLRQEVGAMLPIVQTEGPGMGQTFYCTPDTLIFSTATVENGRAVNVDVKYKLVPDPTAPGRGMLIRYRDKTGPYMYNDPATPNPPANCKLGDALAANFVDPYDQADIMLTDVRLATFSFTIMNPPPPTDPTDTTLAPRGLPSGVQMKVSFGAEKGNADMFETATFVFPVYRGK